MIYADNAATTPLSDAALQALTNCARNTWGNPSSLYELGQHAKEVLEDARKRIAACIGANPQEIIFTSGGSEADNQAIRSAALLGARKGKRHIISTAFEHHAVLHTLKKLEREGFKIELLPVGDTGTVTAQQVAHRIRNDTALVTVMYANNEIGSVLPIAEIGAVCSERGVLFHTDAVQAVGHIPIDVKKNILTYFPFLPINFMALKGWVRSTLVKASLFQALLRAAHKNAANVLEQKIYLQLLEWRQLLRRHANTSKKTLLKPPL